MVPSRTNARDFFTKPRSARPSDGAVLEVGVRVLLLSLAGSIGCAHALSAPKPVAEPPSSTAPVESAAVVPVTSDPVAEIALSFERSCARTAAGVVKCWGLGYDDAPHPAPYALPGITHAVQLAVGPTHGCARLSSGRLKCFGANGAGALGDGTREPSLAATADPGVESAIDVAVGTDFTCARVGHESLCWGDNHRGSLGLGMMGEGELRPVVVPLLSGARALSLAGRHGLAVVDGEGIVLGWGDDAHGLIGTSASPKPVPIKLGALLHVRDLASSSSHACARFDSGTVACWGENDDGQLGDGTTTRRDGPVPVLGVSGAVQIAVGERMSCARLASGGVSCWGANEHGQLGDGTTVAHALPQRVPGLSSVVQIGVGGSHACALLEGGEVQCWGGNAHGELGDRTTASRSIRGPVVF